ncbi:MAG: hypothetical protein KKA32_16925 [Actinobacteria bacterium]|nr:hypothetical protein [Actinomycetota bacterium]
MQFIGRRRIADRIWQSRKITYSASSIVVALGMIAVFLLISTPSSDITVSTQPTFFEAPRAFRAAQELAERFPDPALGSEQAELEAQYVADRLEEFDIPHDEQRFTVPFGHTAVALRNVYTVFPGASREAILVTASRDPDPTSQLSPLANATGTAILLDLAQVFAARPHERTIILLSTEGGAYGGLGLARFLEDDPLGQDVRVVLAIRGLGREERKVLHGGVSGPDGSTPGWYLRLVSRALRESNLSLETTGLARQVADQSLRIAWGPQVAGLRAGIPSLLLHDPDAGAPSSAGMATHGTTIERIVMSLDSGAEIPTDPGTAIVLDSGRFLTRRAISFLGLLTLLPAALMAITWLGVSRVRPEVWVRYLRNLLSFALPLGLFVLVTYGAARIGLVPRYSHQAPLDAVPARDPDYFISIALLMVGLILFLLSRHYLGHLRTSEPLIMTETMKLSTGLVVLVVGLGVLTFNSPFSLLTGLTAAWLWPLVTCFAEPRDARKWLRPARKNSRLLLAGLAAPAMLYAYLVLTTDVRWWQGCWYLLVQSVSGAYGLWGPLASVLITAGFFTLLGVRRLQLIPVETLDEEEDFDRVGPPAGRVKKMRDAGVPGNYE